MPARPLTQRRKNSTESMATGQTANRFFHIDLLRAIAILGLMITHSLALFLGTTAVNSAWNHLHFVVVAFVFCSGYVTDYTYERNNNGKSVFAWYKKRFIRLYLPYLAYLLFYTMLLFLFPAIIAGRGISLNTHFFLDSIALTGGADVGWLTLLFLQLAVLTPILMRINRNNKRLTVALTICGLLACITTFIRIPAVYSRAIAWFPWLFIFLIGSFTAQKDQHKGIRTRYVFLTGFLSICAWFLSTGILNSLHQPLTLTLHKYPPDMFYFLYGIGLNSLLLGIGKLWKHPCQCIRSPITWISKHSYSMFFTHLVLLDIVTKTISGKSVFTTMIISIGSTFLFTWGWTTLAHQFNEILLPNS